MVSNYLIAPTEPDRHLQKLASYRLQPADEEVIAQVVDLVVPRGSLIPDRVEVRHDFFKLD